MTSTSPDTRTRRRRWLGALCLLGAIGMLVLEQTALKGRLAPVAALAYWLVCLVLTLLAAGIALVDLQVARLKGRAEQRGLMEKTLREIEREKHPRQQDGE